VQSVARALELLTLTAELGGETTLTELAMASGLPAPTVHRLAQTLAAAGFMSKLSTRHYALGPRLIALGEVASQQVTVLARPYLEEAVRETGETANLASLDGDVAMYLCQAASRHSVRMFVEVGRRVELHCTAVGKIFLARMNDAKVQRVLRGSGLTCHTTTTITNIVAMQREIDAVRQRGFAVDNGEMEMGVRCVAVAVAVGPSALALSVSGPDTRMNDVAIRRFVPILRRISSEISAVLAVSSS
jgi:IclR family transcriptional regulator, acetate operon repressor